MLKKMLINASHPEECRVAVVCDGLLEELDVQVSTHEATLGNIYKGVISRIEPSLQAVFVDYGTNKNGFLSINDVHPSYFPENFEINKRRPKIQDVFKKDAHVLVQVNKEERTGKGASLTTNISLAGRYLVLMPGTSLYGVSRKIEDEIERKKLKEIVKQLKMPPNMGFIIRTAGMGRTKTELSRDLDYLLKLWDSIEKHVTDMPAPALLYKEHDLVIRSIREHFSPEISEILVDDKDVHKRVKDFFHQVMPKYESAVKFYQEKRPLFNKYQLEEQIEAVYSRKIKLKSGGHIVIEQTEALVSVDVNSGSATKEKGIEETAFRVNLEAAHEIARQLRLRDLGGIIVIDFIDMSQKRHKQEIEKGVRSALKLDRAKTKILRISTLGILELSRQRLKSSLGTGEYLDCPHCNGQGKTRSPETAALAIFRKIKSLALKSDVHEVKAIIPTKTAEYLLNNMRSQLSDLERTYATKINILMRQSSPDTDVIIESSKEEQIEHQVPELASPQIIETVVGVSEIIEVQPVIEKLKVEPKPKKTRKRSPRKKKEPTAQLAPAPSVELEQSIEPLQPETSQEQSDFPDGNHVSVEVKEIKAVPIGLLDQPETELIREHMEIIESITINESLLFQEDSNSTVLPDVPEVTEKESIQSDSDKTSEPIQETADNNLMSNPEESGDQTEESVGVEEEAVETKPKRPKRPRKSKLQSLLPYS